MVRIGLCGFTIGIAEYLETFHWRLHGLGSAYRPYTDEELRTLAGMVPAGAEVYAMFNNIPRVADSKRFRAMLGNGVTRPTV